MVGLAVLQVGVAEAVFGMFTYFVIMASNGFLPLDVIGCRNNWVSKIESNMEDSYGQEWVFHHFIAHSILQCIMNLCFMIVMVKINMA